MSGAPVHQRCSGCQHSARRVYVCFADAESGEAIEGMRCLSCHPTLDANDDPPKTPPTSMFGPGFICGRACSDGSTCRQLVSNGWQPCSEHPDALFPGGKSVYLDDDRDRELTE